MLSRETIRRIFVINLLDTFVQQGCSKERAEFEVEKMNSNGEIGMSVDLLFNKMNREIVCPDN